MTTRGRGPDTAARGRSVPRRQLPVSRCRSRGLTTATPGVPGTGHPRDDTPGPSRGRGDHPLSFLPGARPPVGGAPSTPDEESTHEPPGRPGHRRLGRGEPGRTRSGVRRGRRGHHRLRRRTHPRCREDRLEDRAAGPGPPRLRRQGRLREAALRQGHLERRHRRALRRQQQLVRRLRLLVLQALRPPGREAARRRAQEVGARRPQARRRGALAGQPPTTRPRSRTSRSARSATRSSTRSARRTWSTSARPTSSPGKLLAPAHLPQEQAQRGGHIPSALNVPWSKAANEDGTFRSDEELRELYGSRGPGLVAAPRSPTAASASAPRTPGSPCTSCWASPTSRTTTGPGPSTARWSACRSRRATGSPDVRRT